MTAQLGRAWKATAFRRLIPKLGTEADIASACGCTENAVRGWADPERTWGPNTMFFIRLSRMTKAKLDWDMERTAEELYDA